MNNDEMVVNTKLFNNMIADNKRLIDAIHGALHHNETVKPEYRLPNSLVKHLRDALVHSKEMEIANPLKENDYILVDGAAWFTVKQFSIRIHSTDEGVVVDVYPLHKEMDEAIASTYAFDAEAVLDTE